MEHLYEKIAYLKGLTEGLGIKEEDSKEGKVLLHIIDTLEYFADAIVEMNEEQEGLTEYVEALDEDLADVEDELFESDEDEEDDDDIDFMEIECPHCNEEIFVDEDLFYEDDVDVVCPRCNEGIALEGECHHGNCCGHHNDDDDEE